MEGVWLQGQRLILTPQGWVSGTGGGISVMSTGGVCIAPSGVQKERMQPHEIFTVPFPSCDCVAEAVAGAAPAPTTPLHLPHVRPLPPLPDSPSGLNISQCTPLFMVAYRLRSGCPSPVPPPPIPPTSCFRPKANYPHVYAAAAAVIHSHAISSVLVSQFLAHSTQHGAVFRCTCAPPPPSPTPSSFFCAVPWTVVAAPPPPHLS